MKRSISVFIIAAMFAAAGAASPAAAEPPGSCVGAANAPAAHCSTYGANASVVDMCRCSGSSPATCGPTGSYFCQTQLGKKIPGSSGNACAGACSWVTAPEAEALDASADPVLQIE